MRKGIYLASRTAVDVCMGAIVVGGVGLRCCGRLKRKRGLRVEREELLLFEVKALYI